MKKLKLLSLAVCAALMVGSTTVSASSEDIESEKFTFLSYDFETKEIKYIECDTSFVGEDNIVLSASGADDIIDLIQDYDDISPNAIINGDSFFKISNTKIFPYCAICKLEITFKNSKEISYGGTGFLISSDIVVTAAHCVYDFEHELGEYDEIKVIPGQRGTEKPFGVYEVKSAYMPTSWSDNGNTEYDFCVIKLKRPVESDFPGFLEFNTELTTDLKTGKVNRLVGVSANVIGYSGGQKDSSYMWKAGGAVQEQIGYRIYFDCDTQKGSSGAPVMTFSNKVIGINNYDSQPPLYLNSGTLMTQQHVNLIHNLASSL